MLYLQVAAVLFALTGLEIATYAEWLGAAFIPLLLIMMAVKFGLVACSSCTSSSTPRSSAGCSGPGSSWRWCVYVAALSTFKFFATT